jgi:UV DNA damage endonuclease
VNTQLPSAARTARLANLTTERIVELVDTNLSALEAILRWNRRHRVQVFRLTSNLIPYGSHPANTLPWADVFADRFARLGRMVRAAGMRLSTHPGQYTVLSSTRRDVVTAAVAELDYHDRLLRALGLGPSHKIVVHPGAGVSDPDGALDRFARGFALLSPGAAARLVLENDERWPLETTLGWAHRLGIPVAFDAFHHTLAPSFEGRSMRELVLRAGATWKRGDGRQEVHFSTQAPGKRAGAHAETIDLRALARFVDEVGDLPLDCILEVKDKEQSLLRARAMLASAGVTRGSCRGRAGRARTR